jgi:glyoxylase-like metal-dependent hydrolase (beta-lactamase superfamily II)
METLAAGASFIDLHFQSTPRVIATVVLHGAGGVALIDPGPTSALPSLTRQLSEAGIGLGDVTTLVLTHIHLDHAGVTGTLLREHPKMRVYVHREGVRHLVNPEKLLASAARLYGGAMDRLWGEVRPVPVEAIVPLEGGERVVLGGRSFAVAYTPGHASHHVSYFSDDMGIAFVGDTGGVRLAPQFPVVPPTPPPDIDLDAWAHSLARIERWRPGTLFLTHFGPVTPVDAHLAELRSRLDAVLKLAQASLDVADDEASREVWFVDRCREELARHMAWPDVRLYETSARLDLNWRGLARYLRKRTT